MAFKLKDLMISLLPPGGERACPTASAPEAQLCPTASADFCPTASAGRGVQVVFCQTASAPVLVVPATPFCPTASAGFCPTASAGLKFCPTASAEAAVAEACPTASAPAEASAGGAEGLALLKQQLQQALEQVEAQEKAMAEPGLPQTVAETEELEAKLREALEELRQHKENLQKG